MVMILSSIIAYGIFIACTTTNKSSGGDNNSSSQEEEKHQAYHSDLSYTFPVTDSPNPSERTQVYFDEYGWQMFVAMCWPASSTMRGVPDTTKSILSPGNSIPVWMSLKTSTEAFKHSPDSMMPWDTGYPNDQLRLISHSKVAENIKPFLGSIDQAVGGSLIDQNSNFSYYERYMNQVEYDYILDNKFYDGNVLNALNKDVKFPATSMEIKSAWTIIEQDDDASKFFTTKAMVAKINENTGEPTGEYMEKLVGLTGLHIAYKTSSSPQWVWATFEHIGNNPIFNTPDSIRKDNKYTYYNPECDSAACPANQQTFEPGKPIKPTQVVRMTLLTEEAKALNAQYQKALKGTAWENYKLIATQWPTDPKNPANPQGTPAPNILANTTMETFIPLESSCMGCHSTARTRNSKVKTDYSFLLLEANTD